MPKKLKVRVHFTDGKYENYELVWDDKKGVWKLLKPGLLGSSFLTVVISADHDAVKSAVESATGRSVSELRIYA